MCVNIKAIFIFFQWYQRCANYCPKARSGPWKRSVRTATMFRR